jgi:DNA-binding IclR family transcriptional regulator
MLAALTRAGYLVRDPRDRRYRLGPALIRPGEIAARQFPGLESARAEMDELTRTLGLACLAFAPLDGHARLVASTWDPRRPAPSLSVGDLLPTSPPLGSVFVAWAGETEIAGWLQKSSQALVAVDTYRGLLADIRARGYVVEFRTPPSFLREMEQLDHSPSMREAVARLLETGEQSEIILPELDRASGYRVGSISTPVFDRDGKVCLALDVADFPDLMKGAEIERIAKVTRASADRVTAALGGRLPRAPQGTP